MFSTDLVFCSDSNDEPDPVEGLYRSRRTDAHSSTKIGKDFRHDFIWVGGFGAVHRRAQAADENAHDASGTESDDDSRV